MVCCGSSDWIVPRRLMCFLFWTGTSMLFVGIILIVTTKHKGQIYQPWGGLILGFGTCALLVCLGFCIHAYHVIAATQNGEQTTTVTPNAVQTKQPKTQQHHVVPSGSTPPGDRAWNDRDGSLPSSNKHVGFEGYDDDEREKKEAGNGNRHSEFKQLIETKTTTSPESGPEVTSSTGNEKAEEGGKEEEDEEVKLSTDENISRDSVIVSPPIGRSVASSPSERPGGRVRPNCGSPSSDVRRPDRDEGFRAAFSLPSSPVFDSSSSGTKAEIGAVASRDKPPVYESLSFHGDRSSMSSPAQQQQRSKTTVSGAQSRGPHPHPHSHPHQMQFDSRNSSLHSSSAFASSTERELADLNLDFEATSRVLPAAHHHQIKPCKVTRLLTNTPVDGHPFQCHAATAAVDALHRRPPPPPLRRSPFEPPLTYDSDSYAMDILPVAKTKTTRRQEATTLPTTMVHHHRRDDEPPAPGTGERTPGGSRRHAAAANSITRAFGLGSVTVTPLYVAPDRSAPAVPVHYHHHHHQKLADTSKRIEPDRRTTASAGAATTPANRDVPSVSVTPCLVAGKEEQPPAAPVEASASDVTVYDNVHYTVRV